MGLLGSQRQTIDSWIQTIQPKKRSNSMKHMLLVAVILTFCVGISAQTVFGVRAGLNFANWAGEYIEDNSAKTCFHLGGMMQYPLSPILILQPELLYTGKGFKISDDDYDEYQGEWEFSYKANLSYLEVPVLIKYNANLQGFKLQPYLGPSLALLVGAKEKYSYESDEDGDYDYTNDFKDEMNSLELGLNLGVDAILRENIMVGLRYNYGLSNIFEDADDDDEYVYNRGFMLNLGYLFGR